MFGVSSRAIVHGIRFRSVINISLNVLHHTLIRFRSLSFADVVPSQLARISVPAYNTDVSTQYNRPEFLIIMKPFYSQVKYNFIQSHFQFEFECRFCTLFSRPRTLDPSALSQPVYVDRMIILPSSHMYDCHFNEFSSITSHQIGPITLDQFDERSRSSLSFLCLLASPFLFLLLNWTEFTLIFGCST